MAQADANQLQQRRLRRSRNVGAASLVCAAAAAPACTKRAATSVTTTFVPTVGSVSHGGHFGAEKLRAAQQQQQTRGMRAAAAVGTGAALAIASLARAQALGGPKRRTLQSIVGRRAGVIDTSLTGDVGGAAFDSMPYVPPGGVPEDQKTEVPRELYEGQQEVNPDGSDGMVRPGGSSKDEDSPYFWKMAKDRRTIDVIVPLPEDVDSKDIIFNLGEDPENLARGPTLLFGYKYKTEEGRVKQHYIIDGNILNAINKRDSFWSIEEMAGMRVCVLSLTRPSMMRKRHDPMAGTSTEEERIEPQTWDALLMEEMPAYKQTHKVFLDLSIEGKKAGRLVWGLYGEAVPRTVKNFTALCTGEYIDDDGNKQESAVKYKGTHFGAIIKEHLMSAGNPGLDYVKMKLSAEELKEFKVMYEDKKAKPVDVGKVKKTWPIRWGADLGLPVGDDFARKAEGDPVDSTSAYDTGIIVEEMQRLDEAGEGAEFIFYRPEYNKGLDCTGTTFKGESFDVPHRGVGMLSMDRDEDKDFQGSTFFIMLREFPQMDKRWTCFGEMLEGHELLDKIQKEYDSQGELVVIEDCGVLED